MTLVVPKSRSSCCEVLPKGVGRRHPVLRGITWRTGLVAVACLLSLAVPVGAVTPAKLIGPDLEAQMVDVTSLNDGMLNYFDEQRTLRSSAIDKFVQLRSIGGEDTGDLSQMPGVWLVDGQRFAGNWVGPTSDGLGLRWRHPLIGVVVVPLEDISRVNWVAGGSKSGLSGMPSLDVVTLINGDTLSGFVSSLTDQGVELVPDIGGAGGAGGAGRAGGAGGVVTIPFGRIASMVL